MKKIKIKKKMKKIKIEIIEESQKEMNEIRKSNGLEE